MPIVSLRKASSPPPSRMTPERTRLSEAIVRLRQAEAAHTAILAADGWDGTAATAECNARTALEDAQTALERAHQDAASRLVAASLGDAQASVLTVRDARAAVQQAEDDIAAAVTARATIRERVAPAAKAVDGARWHVETGVRDVIRAETNIDALLSEIDALQHRLADKGRLLEWLTTTGPIPRFGPDANPRAGEICNRFWQFPGSWIIAQTEEQSPSTMAMITAHAALHDDATAPLPGVPA